MSPDQIRAVVYRSTARDLADAAWRQTRAALDGDGGVPIYERAGVVETGHCTCYGGNTVYGHEPGCGLESAGLPIESDTLDARDQARRDAEDEERDQW